MGVDVRDCVCRFTLLQAPLMASRLRVPLQVSEARASLPVSHFTDTVRPCVSRLTVFDAVGAVTYRFHGAVDCVHTPLPSNLSPLPPPPPTTSCRSGRVCTPSPVAPAFFFALVLPRPP